METQINLNNKSNIFVTLSIEDENIDANIHQTELEEDVI